MKVTRFLLFAALTALPGCAANRALAPADPFLRQPAPPGDPQKSLGEPLDELNSGAFSAPLRGRGPVLGHPEARGNAAPRSEKSAGLSPREAHGAAPTPWISRRGSAPGRHANANRLQFLDEPTWSRFYRSTDRRAIETLTLGSGTRCVAVLSSLHGDEPQSVALVEELSRYLRAHPKALADATVLLVRCPNPDGAHGGSAFNSRGVDLNRNFPAPNWKELANRRAGSRAASEVETQILMRLLADFKPAVLVHVKDAREAAAVNFEGSQLEARAREVALLAGCDAVGGLGEKTSGSLEAYALARLGCPSLTLLLAPQSDNATAAARFHDALLAAIEPFETRRAGAPRAFGKSAGDRSSPFEDMVARPSSLSTVRSGSGPAKGPAEPIPDTGYFELPEP